MVIALKQEEHRCPRCGSPDVIKHGIRNTMSKGKRQRLFCKNCARTFYNKEAK